MNSRSFRNEHPPYEGGGGGRLVGNLPLSRQTSIYSLTFDELQSTMGGVGKDFGSMNMDELLKNIWSVEENQNQQTIALSGGQPGGGSVSGGHLQRQGSLTLPRTLSQKTVDEVWKNISGEDPGGEGVAALDLQQQRQPTLGEMTLEEFLVRAGVVREDMNMLGMNLPGRPNNIMNPLGVEFQPFDRSSGLMGNVNPPASNQFSMQSPNLPLNVNGVRHQQQPSPPQQQQSPPQQQQQQLFPQQRTTAYTSSVALPASAQLGSPGINAGLVGLADPTINPNLVQGMGFQGGGMGMVNFGAGAAATMAAGSPVNQLSSDGMGKCNGDTSSVSPVPLALNGGLRGSGMKRSGAVEKVVERRQRRMIKNRESAARSRARKQAYTVELEAEVAKLKEENDELRKRQAELMEMQKNQVIAIMNNEQGSKRRRLRRTQTGPW